MTSLDTLLSEPTTAGVWSLVPTSSRIGFTNRSFWGAIRVKGVFADFSGEGQITRQGGVFGRLDIRAASLSTGVGKRDEHLRSPDFFDVERFPDISVVVTALQPTTGNSADLRATLTVKGTTKTLALPATISGVDADTVRISAKTKIDRTQWDVTGNLLGMVVRTTTLVADLVFTRAEV